MQIGNSIQGKMLKEHYEKELQRRKSQINKLQEGN